MTMASKDRQNAVTAEMETDSFAGIGDVVDNQQAFEYSIVLASGSERRRGSDSVWGGKP